MRRKKSVPVYIPSGQAQAASKQRRRLREMTQEEQETLLKRLHTGLAKQSGTIRNYLDGRARRNIHTPTDSLYEEFYELDQELLWFLEQLLEEIPEEGGQP